MIRPSVNTSNHTPLHGVSVVALRPLHALRSVERAVARAGGRLFSAPVQRIVALNDAATRNALQSVDAKATTIFTSPQAVRHAAALRDLAELTGTVLAVGPGTAAALQAEGLEGVVFPDHAHNSEGLLALAELRDCRSVALVSGRGGRGLIEAELRDRGCDLQRIDVYERRPRRLPAAQRNRLLQLPAPVVWMLSSLDALDAWQADRELAAASCDWHVLVASPRLATACMRRGLRVWASADSAMPDAMCQCLIAHANARPFR